MGNAEGRVTHLSCLFAEYGTEQALFGGKLRLTLRGDLTHKDIAGAHLGTSSDNTVGRQVLKRVVADVRDLSCYLLRSELCISCLVRIFLYVNRRVGVVSYKIFVEKNCVLVVIALPCHEADESVLTEGNFAVRGRGTVGNDLSLLDIFALIDDGTLVDAGALVGALELDEVIGIFLSVVGSYNDLVGRNALDGSGFLCADNDSGVNRSLVLHTGSDDGRVTDEKRHSLLLHIRSHKSARVVVVLKEGDHSRCDRNDHLRGDVHVIGNGVVHLDDLCSLARGDLTVDETVVFVKRLVCLSDYIFILDVGGHVLDFIRDNAGRLVYPAVGSLDEAVVADPCIGCKVGDKTDVRSFRRLDRAHSAVVGVVNVTDLERSAVTGKSARSECRQTALVRQLSQRIVLIHELGQRRRSEELSYRGHDGTDVDKSLGRERFVVLDIHSLLDDLVHSGEADPELVLEKLSDGTQTAVSEVVYIVGRADIVREADKVVYGGEDIVLCDVLRNKLGDTALCLCLHCFDVVTALLRYLKQDACLDLFVYPAVLQVVAEDVLREHGAV